ncbi:MAG: lytic transglycosylase domain-containing protein, partial [Sinorhizobium fredii]|nr:lytic transglycosylase domain-containing protein [Sinorhizobium fredii]
MRGPLLLPVATLFGAAMLASSAFATETRIPVPTVKPGSTSKSGRVVANEVTGAIRAATALTATDLKAGLDALSDRKPIEATAIRNRMGEGTLDRHILSWAIAVSGQRDVPSYEIAEAQRELHDWPGLKTLRAHSERALYRENPPATDVIAAFGSTRPETAEGAIILTRALVAGRKGDAAAGQLRAFWLKEALDKETESKILAEFSSLLTPADHRRRMEMLLYRSRVEQSQRFSESGQAQSLYRAWAAVVRGNGKAAALIKAVDPSWRDDPAYLFVRIEYLRKQERFEEAAELLALAPKDSDALVDPGEWWTEQRIVSRGLLDKGDFRGAYRVAAHHAATEATDVVDAEFHAGWYALRGL